MIINIVKGVIESLSQMWRNHEFEDFKVIVDGDIYTCHSVILASCSEFFASLLRSNMKEKQKMVVNLKNISSPIFQRILNSLYTGCTLLTKENVLEVWSAVHQLQIHFLIKHCEDFVVEHLSIDTVESYKEQADYLQSERVSEYIYNFILTNFATLRKKETFFGLDCKYLIKLFNSDKLEVRSENLVLYSILDWVNYGNSLIKYPQSINSDTENEHGDVFLNTTHGLDSTQNMEEPVEQNTSINTNINCIRGEPNDNSVLKLEEPNKRKELLLQLLQASRYYLASEACILRLYTNKLIQSNILVKDILFEAFHFKCSDYWHGHWPTQAIHRDCSNVEHVGVTCNNGDVLALSFKQKKWFYMKDLPKKLDASLTIFKGKLYACSVGDAPNEVYVFQTYLWKLVTVVSHSIQFVLTHDKGIYVFDSLSKQITLLNVGTTPIEHETFGHDIEKTQYALSFYNNIVVFSSVANNGVEETAVHSWNTETDVWTKLGNLKFTSQNMASFRGDSDTYILDINGNLWKLTNSETIGFTFMAKLWREEVNIKGVVLFRETLFIFDDSEYQLGLLDKVEGVYSSKTELQLKETASNLIHFVVPTRELNRKSI